MTVRFAEGVIFVNKTVGFIGCGNMGGALAAAAAKAVDKNNIFVSDADAKKAEAFSEKYGVKSAAVSDVAKNADYIFLGVKPQILKTLFSEIGDILSARESRVVLISMAAGVNIASLTALAGKEYPVIRIMPNMPVSVGEGMILFDANNAVSEDEINEFKELMRFAGELDRLEEGKIDAASCVSGCGPAFVYLFIEALADGAVACGLSRDKALKYAAQTLAGSAKALLESGKHPGEMKDAVCSPAGSTIQGVRALEEGAFRADAMNAVIKAYERTLELGK